VAPPRRFETGKRAETVDLEALAREVGGEVLGTGGSSRTSLRIGPLPQALGDPALLRQVWQNLLSNAVKFCSREESRRSR
jgi:signal transduction histidine kinase